jgi:hypothetical protein
MAAHRILYFSATEHRLYRSSFGGLELEGRFGNDENGLAEFHGFLADKAGALFAVLADLAGEDFHEEQIPLVRGGDREAVVARRLAQRYRDARLATALPLGAVTVGERKNERVLLASFTNTQLLVPWLDALEAAGTKLSGVYSVPLLAPALAAALAAREPRLLVVSAHRAGLRQCYLENGRIRFGRLEPTVDAAPATLAAFVRTESHRLLQYLITLRALPRDSGPVKVLVIAPAGERAAFESALNPDAGLIFRTIDYAEAARAIKLKRAPAEMQAEALFVYLAARKPPSAQFASRDERRRYLVWQLQRGIVAAGAAGFLACALFSASRWADVLDTRTQAAEQAASARNAAQQYERITASFPVTDTTTENLKVTVVEFRRIAERSSSPERSLRHVAAVLDRYPQFELDALRWNVGKLGEARDGASAGTPAPASVPAPGNAKGDDRSELYVFIEVSGRVNATQRNDYRAITAQVQNFASALVGEGYQLVRTQLPFDVTSEGTLSGDMGTAAESNEAPRFTITIGRRLP